MLSLLENEDDNEDDVEENSTGKFLTSIGPEDVFKEFGNESSYTAVGPDVFPSTEELMFCATIDARGISIANDSQKFADECATTFLVDGGCNCFISPVSNVFTHLKTLGG